MTHNEMQQQQQQQQQQHINKLFTQQMMMLDNNNRTFRIDNLLNPPSVERKAEKLHPFGCNCSDALSVSSVIIPSFLSQPEDNGSSTMLDMYINCLREHLLQRDHIVREDTVTTIATLPAFLQNLCGLLPQLFQMLNLQQIFGSMSVLSRPGALPSSQLKTIQLVLLLMCTEYHCIHEVLLGTRLLSAVIEIVFMVSEEQLCSIVCQVIRRLLLHSNCDCIIQYLLEVRRRLQTNRKKKRKKTNQHNKLQQECHLIELILDSQTLNNSFMSHLITVAAR